MRTVYMTTALYLLAERSGALARLEREDGIRAVHVPTLSEPAPQLLYFSERHSSEFVTDEPETLVQAVERRAAKEEARARREREMRRQRRLNSNRRGR